MKPKTKALLFILIAFILGVVVGSVYGQRIWTGFGSRPSAQEFRAEFHKRLDLKPEQVVAVDSLMDAFRDRMNLQRKEMMRIRDSLRAQINTLLTDQQRERYDALVREMDGRSGRSRSDSTRSTSH